MRKASAWTQSFLALEQALLIENVRLQQMIIMSNVRPFFIKCIPNFKGTFSNGTPPPSTFNRIANGNHAPLGQFSPIALEDCSVQICKTALKRATRIGDNGDIVNYFAPDIFHNPLWVSLNSAYIVIYYTI